MTILIHLYASYACHLPSGSSGNSCTLDVEEGSTVAGVLEGLGLSVDAPKIIFLNGLHAEGTSVLRTGDRLAVFPPIAGG
jgi:sulfur carrier protein ThiS